MSSVLISRVTVSAERSVENVSTGPVGSWRTRDEGREVGHHRHDPVAGHERHQVEPVRADVADGAERAAAIRLQPPVPVTGEEEPVLEVAAGHQPDLAERSGRDDVAGVLVQRVVADVEVDRVDEAAGRRRSRPGRSTPRTSARAASRRRRGARTSRTAIDWLTWRSLGEVTWTTSTVGSASSSSSEA